MINDDFIGYLFDSIFDLLIYEKPNCYKITSLYTVYEEALAYLLRSDMQIFTNDYAKTAYIASKYRIAKPLIRKLKQLAVAKNNITKGRKTVASNSEAEQYALALATVIELVFDEVMPDKLKALIGTPELEFPKEDETPVSSIECLRVYFDSVIEKIGSDAVKIKLYDDFENSYSVVLYPPWAELANFSKKGSAINLINFIKKGENELVANNDSLAVFEPDYLFDVTEIAECSGSRGITYFPYLLKKFAENKVSAPMVLGNLVNFIFDELIDDLGVDFETALKRAYHAKPLQLIALSATQPDGFAGLRRELASQFQNLKNNVAKFINYEKSVEPSFISPKYGLQGRLDLLLESDSSDEGSEKSIIELKSGKAPLSAVYVEHKDYHSGTVKKYDSGVWVNHLAQVTCYNLVLDAAFPNRSGFSAIFYSKDIFNPIRNVPNIPESKQEVIASRNRLMAIELGFNRGNHQLLENLTRDNIAEKYNQSRVDEFERTYSRMSDMEKSYFHGFITFISREIYCSKIGMRLGGDTNKGFSGLWLDSIGEKEQKYSIISELKLNKEKSDFEANHLYFEKSNRFKLASFRKGDICLLYKLDREGYGNPVGDSLLKGIIREISDTHVLVSLRNKLAKSFFSAELWALEYDFVDSGNKVLFNALYRLFSGDERMKRLVLGVDAPRSTADNFEPYSYLNDVQKEIFSLAISADDYFLIQGPPGTGKTSYMLRSLVQFYFENTQQNILIAAYTNRAVDEICSSLTRLSDNFPFLRLGSKDSSDFKEFMPAYLAEDIKFGELSLRISQTRVFVATVSFLNSNSEIFDIKNFDVAIIDEASQIIEPQIVGVLSRVKKFILIGDEKQLPAVVVQLPELHACKNESLNNLELYSFAGSLFERLVHLAIKNNWRNAYSMLCYQARMHSDIMTLANELFYGNKLESIQISKAYDDVIAANPFLNKVFAGKRIAFIDVPTEPKAKINGTEAGLAADISRQLYNSLSSAGVDPSIGVIAPFRAQCALIQDFLDEDLKPRITVDTVERYQGSERDVILFSATANYDFMLDRISSVSDLNGERVDRKLNVAITRAKEYLVIIGNSRVLSTGEVYSKMIALLRDKSNFINIDTIYNT